MSIEGAPDLPHVRATGHGDGQSQYGGTDQPVARHGGGGMAVADTPRRTGRRALPAGLGARSRADHRPGGFQGQPEQCVGGRGELSGSPRDVGALVSEVDPGAPADGHLTVRRRDHGSRRSARPRLRWTSSGDAERTARGVERRGRVYPRRRPATDAIIPTGTRPDGSAGAYLGVILVDNYTSDFTATVSLDGIGGPSAGLAFYLGHGRPDDAGGDARGQPTSRAPARSTRAATSARSAASSSRSTSVEQAGATTVPRAARQLRGPAGPYPGRPDGGPGGHPGVSDRLNNRCPCGGWGTADMFVSGTP